MPPLPLPLAPLAPADLLSSQAPTAAAAAASATTWQSLVSLLLPLFLLPLLALPLQTAPAARRRCAALGHPQPTAALAPPRCNAAGLHMLPAALWKSTNIGLRVKAQQSRECRACLSPVSRMAMTRSRATTLPGRRSCQRPPEHCLCLSARASRRLCTAGTVLHAHAARTGCERLVSSTNEPPSARALASFLPAPPSRHSLLPAPPGSPTRSAGRDTQLRCRARMRCTQKLLRASSIWRARGEACPSAA